MSSVQETGRVIFLHAAAERVLPVPILVTEAGNFDVFAGTRYMDGAVVAGRQVDVENPSTHRVEKRHVARLQFAVADYRTHLCLHGGRARQADTHAIAEDVLHEATAIETSPHQRTTPAVYHARQPHRAAGKIARITVMLVACGL